MWYLYDIFLSVLWHCWLVDKRSKNLDERPHRMSYRCWGLNGFCCMLLLVIEWPFAAYLHCSRLPVLFSGPDTPRTAPHNPNLIHGSLGPPEWATQMASRSNQINILFIDVSASHLDSGVGRQYVKACPIHGSIGSSPRLDSC